MTNIWFALSGLVVLALTFASGYVKGQDDLLLKQAEAKAVIVKDSVKDTQKKEDQINKEYANGVPPCDLDGLKRTLDGLRG